MNVIQIQGRTVNDPGSSVTIYAYVGNPDSEHAADYWCVASTFAKTGATVGSDWVFSVNTLQNAPTGGGGGGGIQITSQGVTING